MKAENLTALSAKFHPDDLEWRVSRSGKTPKGIWCKVLCYVTNRAIMNRLDKVCGPQDWCNLYQEWHGASQLCGISIRLDDPAGWVTKWDGAEQTHVEAIKGGLSDAMKRAAVQWGIGRYLYELPETMANVSAEEKREAGWHWAKLSSGGDSFWWQTPKLPHWALPDSLKEAGDRLAGIKRVLSACDAKYKAWPAVVAWINEGLGTAFGAAAELQALDESQLELLEQLADEFRKAKKL